MTQSELAALAKGLAPVVRESVAAATAPLLEQIDALRAELEALKADAVDTIKVSELPKHLENYKEYIDRVNVKGHHVSEAVDEIKARLDALPDIDTKLAEVCRQIGDEREQDAAQVTAWMDGIEQRVAEVEARPQPKDGADGKDADPAEIARMVSEAVDALPKPEDGKSVTVEDVQPLIDERVSVAVSEAVKALPAPKDGKDGVGVAGALIDRDGGLVLTLTDGTQRDLGAVVGKDGEPGKDGLDGLGFDDMDMVVADDGVALVFTRGEQKKAFALPIVFDRGVFKADTAYRKGNGVTWGGQFWIAQKDNPEGKPDASSDWRLAVKKGRDAPRHVSKVEV